MPSNMLTHTWNPFVIWRTGAFFETPRHIIRALLELANLDAGISVLEPGAGIGTLTRAIARESAEVHAIEISPTLYRDLEPAGWGRWHVDTECADAVTAVECQARHRKFDRIVTTLPFATLDDESRARLIPAMREALTDDGVLVFYALRPSLLRPAFRGFVRGLSEHFDVRREPRKRLLFQLYVCRPRAGEG